MKGQTDQKEKVLTNSVTVLGKSAMATVRLKGWLKPQMAAQINQRDDGYYLGPGDKVPKINGKSISGQVRLNDGDLIEVSGGRLNFIFREYLSKRDGSSVRRLLAAAWRPRPRRTPARVGASPRPS